MDVLRTPVGGLMVLMLIVAVVGWIWALSNEAMPDILWVLMCVVAPIVFLALLGYELLTGRRRRRRV